MENMTAFGCIKSSLKTAYTHLPRAMYFTNLYLIVLLFMLLIGSYTLEIIDAAPITELLAKYSITTIIAIFALLTLALAISTSIGIEYSKATLNLIRGVTTSKKQYTKDLFKNSILGPKHNTWKILGHNTVYFLLQTINIAFSYAVLLFFFLLYERTGELSTYALLIIILSTVPYFYVKKTYPSWIFIIEQNLGTFEAKRKWKDALRNLGHMKSTGILLLTSLVNYLIVVLTFLIFLFFAFKQQLLISSLILILAPFILPAFITVFQLSVYTHIASYATPPSTPKV